MPEKDINQSDSAEGTDYVDFNKDECVQDDHQQRLALKHEHVRLETFRDWPASIPVRPQELAKEGFFYLNTGDKAKCIFCNVILKSWEQGDVVRTEHAKFNPRCAFLLGKDVGNVAIVASPDRHSGPRYPRYGTLDAREASFADMSKSMEQTPRLLAEAGFFYTGFGDRVRCYCCGGDLRNWESGDDPWTEHQHWFPACEHLKSRPVSNESFEITDVVQKCLDMGYDRELVKNAVTKKRKIGGGEFEELNCLIDSVENLRVQKETMSRAQAVVKETGAAAGSPGETAGGYSVTSGASSMEDEYKEMKEQRLCKICMERDVEITFVPCGHLVACDICASKLKECPMCRQRIRASVRTFMV